MFVLTMKWNKKTAVLIVAAAALLLAVIIMLCGKSGAPSGAGQLLDTNDARVSFLESLGWEIDSEPVEEKCIVIPQEFSAVYEEYNRLQQAQGFDLSNFCGMEATIYTYAVHNYEGYVGGVVADVYICKGELIGGDIHSLALDGFMHGLKHP